MFGKSNREYMNFLVGRLHAQNRILLALFGYFMVADRAFAEGTLSALTGLAKNADKIVKDEQVQIGFIMELTEFISQAERVLKPDG